MSEMNEGGDYTDDQVEAILNAFDVSDEDFGLASFVAEARSIAIEPVDADLARRHVTMLAEAAHFAYSRAPTEQKVDGRPGGQATTVTPFTARRRRLVTKAAVVGLAAVLMGGSIAGAATGSLPAPAQAAIAGMAAHIGIDIPSRDDDLPAPAATGQSIAAANQASAEEMAGNIDFAKAVQDAISRYKTALGAWTDCVAGTASGRGSSRGKPDTSTEDEFDPAEGCGERPTLVIPRPADFGPGSAEDSGPPEGAGPPADHSNGPPPDGGPPAGLP